MVPFCQEKLGLSRGYKPNRYRELLQPAIDELIEKRYLAQTPEEKLFERLGHGVYRVNFHSTRRVARTNSQVSPMVHGLAADLATRGIAVGEACKLVQQFAPEQIQEQIDYFDAEIRRGKKLGPGRLRRGIEQKYKVPERLSTLAKRPAGHPGSQSKSNASGNGGGEGQEQLRREAASRAERRKQVDEILENLSPSQQLELERNALAVATTETRNYYEHASRLGLGTMLIDARYQMLSHHLHTSAPPTAMARDTPPAKKPVS